MTTEQQAKLINETQYGKAGSLTQPIVQEITKKFAHRAEEFMKRPMHETVDIIFKEFNNLLSDQTDSQLQEIASRWGTEHVMQSIEMSIRMKQMMEQMQNPTKSGDSNIHKMKDGGHEIEFES